MGEGGGMGRIEEKETSAQDEPTNLIDHSQRICEVWACNLDEEMKKIRQVIRKYNYVAMVCL